MSKLSTISVGVENDLGHARADTAEGVHVARIPATDLHWWVSDCGVKGDGSSASSVQRASSPPAVTLTTSMAGANSTSTCRQIPQGGVGSVASVATTIRLNDRTPAATAAAIAPRSAQMVPPYDAFSTLHPTCTCPSESSSAAPTRKPEYG